MQVLYYSRAETPKQGRKSFKNLLLKLMQPYFIQMVKIQSLPAEVTAFFSKY
jgi:hypothetical protein